MNVYALGDRLPRVHPTADVHSDAVVIGDGVLIGSGSVVFNRSTAGDDAVECHRINAERYRTEPRVVAR